MIVRSICISMISTSHFYSNVDVIFLASNHLDTNYRLIKLKASLKPHLPVEFSLML